MENIDIDKDILKNIDIDIAILENIDISKGTFQNINICKMLQYLVYLGTKERLKIQIQVHESLKYR